MILYIYIHSHLQKTNLCKYLLTLDRLGYGMRQIHRTLRFGSILPRCHLLSVQSAATPVNKVYCRSHNTPGAPVPPQKVGLQIPTPPKKTTRTSVLPCPTEPFWMWDGSFLRVPPRKSGGKPTSQVRYHRTQPWHLHKDVFFLVKALKNRLARLVGNEGRNHPCRPLWIHSHIPD